MIGAFALKESVPFLALNVCCQLFLLIWYKFFLNKHKTNDEGETEELGKVDKHFEKVAKDREAIGLVFKRAEEYKLIEVAHRPSLRTN